MQPKTQLQKQVVESAKRLSPLSEKELKEAFEKISPHILKVDRNGNHYCYDCGHTWKGPKDSQTAICPNCKRKLKRDFSKKRKASVQDWYFASVTICDNMQVVRMFAANMFMRKGKEPKFWAKEVYQYWFDGEDNYTVFGIPRGYMGFSWCWGSEFEIRRESYQHFIAPQFIVGRPKIKSCYNKYGLKRGFYGVSPAEVFKNIRKVPKFEQLWKMKQFDYLNYCNYRDANLDRLWKPLMIAHRHKYKVKDFSLWNDLLETLKRLGKDTHNPKFICPDNLKQAHDHYGDLLNKKLQKERERANRERIQEQLLRDKKDAKDFLREKGKYFGLLFTDNEISVEPLKSIEEFAAEGKNQHHCVFFNRYYAKADSLIFHALVDGKSIATIEFNLKSMQIVQCRGKHNSVPEQKERIENLINKNIGQIANCKKEKSIEAA